MAKRETRREREIREAREAFCRARRDFDLFRRWLAWYHLRSILERWDDDLIDGPDVTGAYDILIEAEKWRRGFRPPTSFHEANGRIRARRREGRLRGSGSGL